MAVNLTGFDYVRRKELSRCFPQHVVNFTCFLGKFLRQNDIWIFVNRFPFSKTSRLLWLGINLVKGFAIIANGYQQGWVYTFDPGIAELCVLAARLPDH